MHHHQRAPHPASPRSPHDAPPRHAPPHDPAYPYHNPYAPSAASHSPCPYCQAPATGFHADPSSGDLICTSCGAVLDDHLRDATAEWREFGGEEDILRGRGPGTRARCGEAVDEAKYVGGLGPTRMSAAAYAGANGLGNGAGASEERHGLAAVRNRLRRTHNVIEHMLGREARERYQEVVLERRAREAKAARGETDANEADNCDEGGRAEVRGDYEGLMAVRGDACALNHKRSTSNSPPSDSERAFAALRDERWSLPAAVLVHGTLDQVRQWADRPPEGEWTQSSLEAARAHKRRRCHRKESRASLASLRTLYLAFALLEGAAWKLDLDGANGGHQTLREATAWLVRFASERDGIRIKGMAGGSPGDDNGAALSLSLDNDGALRELLDQTGKKASPSSKVKEVRQLASLGAALLYLAAKKRGVGRTLTEVCSAFGTLSAVRAEGTAGREAGGEALVRPKHCSRAMAELRTALPEVVAQPPSARAAPAVPSSSEAAVKREEGRELPAKVSPNSGGERGEEALGRPSSASSLSTAASPLPIKGECALESATPAGSDAVSSSEEAALADLVSRMASSLNLPPAAASAAVAVAVRCAREAASTSSTPARPAATPGKSNGRAHIRPTKRRRVVSPYGGRGGGAPEVVAVSSLLLVCIAGGAMQRLAPQALEKDSSSTNIDACDRTQGLQVFDNAITAGGKSTSSNAAVDCAIDDPLDALTDELAPSPALDLDHATAEHDMLASWRAWKSQPPWHRTVSQMEQATGVPRKAIVAHYSAAIHPRRSYFLGAAAGGLGGGNDALLGNISTAVPVMSLRNL
ncbi:hypothetical protein ACHAXT_009165 [Thalassiosira profunda]